MLCGDSEKAGSPSGSQNSLRPFDFASLAVGVAGVIISVITYLWSQHQAAVSYSLSTVKIVNQKEDVPFSVIDKEGARVDGDVYVTNITVWNSGNSPIDVNNIRIPMAVNLSGGVKILDSRFMHGSKISNFRCSCANTAANTIKITWDFFDPGDGFVIQAVYSSRGDVDPMLIGSIFGVDGFKKVPITKRGALERLGLVFNLLMFCAMTWIAASRLVRYIILKVSRLYFVDQVVSSRVFGSIRLCIFGLWTAACAVFCVFAVYYVAYPPSPPF